MATAESEILERVKLFMSAWNAGDAKGAAAVYAEDGIRIGAFGDVARGPEDIEAAYDKLLNGAMRGATATFEPVVRMLTADVAVVRGPLMIQLAGGAATIRGYAADIWRRRAGTWEVVESHPKLFPPPLK